MSDKRAYMYDEKGNITNVLLDYDTYKKMEDLLLDNGLAKAMKESSNDEEFSLEEARMLLRKEYEGNS